MRVGFGTSGIIPTGIKGLLIANAAVFMLQYFIGHRLILLMGLTPSMVWGNGALWQPFTYLFLHGSLTHLFFNMLALWMFGTVLEQVWGTRKFLRYYFITGVGAGLSNCILLPGMEIPIIGASGAIYGILAAYGLLFPNSKIFVYFLFPIRAKYFVIIFGIIEFMSSIMPGDSPIAHLVHLVGMVIGVIYLRQDMFLRFGARKLNYWLRKREEINQKKKAGIEEELRREIDRILDKINEIGLENLSNRDKKRLNEASETLRQIEKEREIYRKANG